MDLLTDSLLYIIIEKKPSNKYITGFQFSSMNSNMLDVTCRFTNNNSDSDCLFDPGIQ